MKPTVLTIDDHGETRRLIRLTLEYKGFVVLEADNGAQGLEMARARRPALILLDRMMPGLNGLKVAETLRADPQLCAIPVIMLSAMAAPHDKEAGLGAGVRAYLVKPFSPLALVDLMKELFAQAARESARPGFSAGEDSR